MMTDVVCVKESRLQLFNELKVYPGDILIIRVDRNTPIKEIQNLRDALSFVFQRAGFFEKNIQFLFLPYDLGIEKISIKGKRKKETAQNLRQIRMIRIKKPNEDP